MASFICFAFSFLSTLFVLQTGLRFSDQKKGPASLLVPRFLHFRAGNFVEFTLPAFWQINVHPGFIRLFHFPHLFDDGQ
jgi:hypothetical protein